MATAKKTTKKPTKADLEAKIAELEAKLNKLAAATEAPKPAPKPAEAPKPAPKPAEKPAAQVKPQGTLPKGTETAPKPAETKPAPKPAETAPKPAEKAPPAPLHERFREIPTGNWNTQKVAITGYTAPGNKYFATKQRLAYHPEAKKFGTWINDAPASGQAKAAPPPPKPKDPKEVYAAEMKAKGKTLPKGF